MPSCAEECDHFIQQAQPRLSRSEAIDAKNDGQGHDDIVSDNRTSSWAFFGRGETLIIDDVEERIAQWVMVDKEQGEGIQVLEYKVPLSSDAASLIYIVCGLVYIHMWIESAPAAYSSVD